MKISSSAFEEGGMIPSRFTCDGMNISPHLKWSPGPDGTKAYALISDDPDASVGTFVHWVMFNIPANKTELPENIPPVKELSDGSRQGKTDFGRIGYGGPCPPGGTHRYYFKIYCLSEMLDLEAGISKAGLLNAMKGHILEEGQLMGKYRRR